MEESKKNEPMVKITDLGTLLLFMTAILCITLGSGMNKWMLFVLGLWILTKLEVDAWLIKRS